jgi:hypothetical protein
MSPLRRGTQVLAATLSLLVLNAPAYAATVTIQPSNQDASILQDSPNRPKGSGTNNTRFHVRTSTVNPRVRRGLVQFDLSAIPQFAIINSAVVSLYQDSSPTGAAHTNNVFRINDPWLQSTVKWNTQPTIQGAATASNATVGPVRQFYSWTVTPDVQIWINAPTSNHGWMVKDAAENGTNEIIAYVSAEEFANPDLFKRPKLVVDFTAPPCSTNADCAENPNNPCTTNERCQAGHCAVDPVVCDDNNACTDNICDPQQGCLFPVGECNDGFDCTIDSCDPQGGCVNTPVNSACTAEGCKVATCVADPDNPNVDPATGCVTTSVNPDNTPCTADANQCTSDVCTSGQCTHPSSPLNTPCAADGNPCTDDVCDGSGVCGVNNSAPCSDGNACTVGDQCSGGSCGSGTPVVCTPLGQCYNAGTCDTQTGQCSNPPKNPGAGCDDGTACTAPDQCDGAGTCVGGNPVVCTPLDQCHNAGTCDAQSGLCSNPPKPDNSACNDGNACTQTDVCTGGTCTGGNSIVCTPLDQCHNAGTCDTQTGFCSNPPKPDNSACNDSNACTQTDVCTGGTCVGSNDVVCTAQGQCFDVGTCDTQTGMCSNPPKPNTSGCNDSDACTQTDTCDGAGTCVGGNPVVCTPLDQCHLAGTCDTQTGLCDDPVKNNGDPCDDGNSCTASDQCMGGTCIGDSGSCGNGMVECGEQCDDAAQNGNGSCTAQCQLVCPPTPQANCRKPLIAKKAKVVLKNKTPDKKDALNWKWVKGAATTLGDFGAPLTTTGYAICVYDASANSQPRLFSFAPPGGTCLGKPCWKTIKNGYKYKDSKLLDPDGIGGITLKAGAASYAKALVKGKGANLGMPSLPLTTPVIVQLKKNDDPGICWDAQFSTTDKNQSDQFKAAAD